MEYTVMARRFRPQAFGEVVGQEAIAQALRNAIAAGRVAHAYLFTGARGVGKTSTARILAKTLNCAMASGGDPCNACEICHGIAEGGDVDVIEIDGASNRGIDEIRSLRANVNIRPMRSKYKIYIIDEVHMLTKEAFNALLKTLEEPPPNVKFVFCTTDPQKLPDTILSRCQRFDFGTIETHRIRQRLAEIAEAEGVEVEPAAIELVARRAAGSMRDSQSLFDQLLAFGGPKVAVADVHRLLGTAPDSRLVEMARALAGRDRQAVLTQLDQALGSGVQAAEFADQLIGCCRDLMVLTAGADQAGLLSVGEDARLELREIGKGWGLQPILAALQILADTKQRMKQVSYGRVLLELGLVRIATLADLEGLAEAVAALRAGKLPVAAAGMRSLPEGAEKKNDVGGSVTAGAAHSGRTGPSGLGAGTVPAQAPAPAPPPTSGPSPSPNRIPEQRNLQTDLSATPQTNAGVPRSESSRSGGTGELKTEVAVDTTGGNTGGVGGPPPGRTSGDHAGAGGAGQSGPSAPPALSGSDSSEGGVQGDVERAVEREVAEAWQAGDADRVWQRVLATMAESPRTKFWKTARPAIPGPNRLVLTLPSWYAAFKENLERTPEVLRELEQGVERWVGSSVRIDLELDTAPRPTDHPEGTRADPGTSERQARQESIRTHPVSMDPDSYVQSAMAVFNAELVRLDRVEASPAESRE